jgi:hypothetical protein
MVEAKKLQLIIQPKIIDHLGIKMYQKPVDVISEFVANAWDADSDEVLINIQNDTISIRDKGIGMTFQQCQDYFLTVGRDRRKATGKETTERKGRPVLGRKGIGKFAGFGIAKIIQIISVSEETGEYTDFEMDIEKILECDSQNQNNKLITVNEYRYPEKSNRNNSGTCVILKGINTSIININDFKHELSRRFLLSQTYDDFAILVNEQDLPKVFDEELEFVFPKDFTNEELSNLSGIQIDEKGWAKESFLTHQIKWKIGFYEDTIETEELRGIAVYAKGKMAQKPFFFDLTGGISGQHGIEYMTGKVEMDFIDEGDNDLIATERQRINLQTPIGQQVKNWGIDRIKLLCSIWKKRRSEKRLRELEDKLEGFSDRLDNLPSTERNTVKSVLLKIAGFERLGKKRYHEWCNDILTSWEKGRLKDLITKMSQAPNADEQMFLEMLSEADVLTALNIAESVKTKILAIGELKQRVKNKQLENKVRDFIYDHPWIIHPKWESFKKERSIENLIKDIGLTHLNTDTFNGRVDLALASGSQLLLIEFMRPKLEIDTDHINRINMYVTDIRNRLNKETGNQIRTIDTAYLIADSYKDIELVHSLIKDLETKNIYILTWNSLIEQALKQWIDYLDLLKTRNSTDKRIQDL